MQSLSFDPLLPDPEGQRRGDWAIPEEWPTLLLLAATIALFAGALALPANFGPLTVVLLILALTLHSSLSHEILHGHPFKARWAQTALGLFQPGLFVPYLRFRDLHLKHHEDSRLTDPYEDPESNFLDPAVWATRSRAERLLLTFNNTLFGRMTLGPAIGLWQFLCDDLRRIRSGDRVVALQWLSHVPSIVVTFWLVGLSPLSVPLYLLACYGAHSVLKIRTFLEHRAHPRASGRTVVIEDRGPLALLFLNNNFHVVHHMHPKVAWYRLPGLYRAHRDRFLRRNDGYVYRSYGQVFRAHFLKTKDPVPHPLWPER